KDPYITIVTGNGDNGFSKRSLLKSIQRYVFVNITVSSIQAHVHDIVVQLGSRRSRVSTRMCQIKKIIAVTIHKVWYGTKSLVHTKAVVSVHKIIVSL